MQRDGLTARREARDGQARSFKPARSIHFMNWIIAIVALGIVIALFALKRMSFVPEEMARKLLQQGALVVDVREPDEFRSTNIPGAMNIPLGELSESLPRRVPDKNQVLLLHCLSGGRSGIATQQIKAMGYTNVFNLGSLSRAKHIVEETLDR